MAPETELSGAPRVVWLDRAEQLGGQDDAGGQFILPWIAVNAAYATKIDERFRLSEQETFRGRERDRSERIRCAVAPFERRHY